MSVGTGIFIGLLFLGLIWLYVATWQRWRWKRITAWLVGIVLVPVIAFGAWMWTDSWLDSYPRLEETFWDLRPGMAANDVLFRKGPPSNKDPDLWLYFEDSDRKLGTQLSFRIIAPGQLWPLRVREVNTSFQRFRESVITHPKKTLRRGLEKRIAFPSIKTKHVAF